MKILAVNGSPRGPRGNTDCVLQPFLEGAREAGAETETVYLKDKQINTCLGCFTCWTKTPGVCVHKDDMPELLDKLREADIVVHATPLYVFTKDRHEQRLAERFPGVFDVLLRRRAFLQSGEIVVLVHRGGVHSTRTAEKPPVDKRR